MRRTLELPATRMFSLRPANQSDAGAIRSLVLQGGINPTGLDWRRFIVAALPSGEVIGCGQIKPHRDGSFEMASIAVRPGWRGRGVARAIITRLLTSHTGELYLMCRSPLGPLYEKFGFRELQEEEMPRYFRRVSRVIRLAGALFREGERLLVMKRAAVLLDNE